MRTAMERMQEQTDLIAGRELLKRNLDRWVRQKDTSALDGVVESINDAHAALSDVHSIRIYDTSGSLAASSDSFPPVNENHQPEFTRDKLRLHMVEGDVLVTLGERLRLSDRIIGYIQINYFSDFLNRLVASRSGLGETGEWMLAVPGENGGALMATNLKYDTDAAFRRTVSADGAMVPVIHALRGNETIMEDATDYRGEPVMAATRYLPDQGWGIVAKVDQSEVHELASTNQSVILGAEAVIILSAIGMGIAVAVYISRPVEKLSRHTEKVAGGELSEPQIDKPGWYEARKLTDHFSYMVQALRDLNNTLQDKVDQRTRELQSVNRELEQLATRDHLTGLYNRRHFDEKFEEEFSRSWRYQRELSVAVLDIDFFKSINDNYGHSIGDEVLRSIAQYLGRTVRETDVAARTGGEEFCILLPETSARAAEAFLERVRHGISELEFNADGREFAVTCSIGIADCGARTATREDMLAHADQSLYRAKHGGRNQVLVFEGEGG